MFSHRFWIIFRDLTVFWKRLVFLAFRQFTKCDFWDFLEKCHFEIFLKNGSELPFLRFFKNYVSYDHKSISLWKYGVWAFSGMFFHRFWMISRDFMTFWKKLVFWGKSRKSHFSRKSQKSHFVNWRKAKNTNIFQKTVKSRKIIQNRWENIPKKAQALYF